MSLRKTTHRQQGESNLSLLQGLLVLALFGVLVTFIACYFA